MKLRLFTIPSILLLAITFIIASCSKDGPAGATGPQGPAGANGAAGAAGATGATGATGTANVIYSDWLDVKFEPYDTDTTFWVTQIIAQNLVDSILRKGEIKVYWNRGNDSVGKLDIIPLPNNDPFYVGAVINPYFSEKLIKLAADLDASTFTINGSKSNQFRYILIPGGTKAGRGVKTIDWNDYKQVQAYLGLKD